MQRLLDGDSDISRILAKYKNAAVRVNLHTWPGTYIISKCLSESFECVPFLCTRRYICVIIRPTPSEYHRNETEMGIRYRDNGVALGWILENHVNLKAFVGYTRGVCCRSKPYNISQVLALGDDFDCGNGFSMFDDV